MNIFINTRKILTKLIVINFISFAFCLNFNLAWAGSLNLAWDASTSTNVGGYIISYGSATQNYTTNIDVGNTTAYTVAGLQNGAKYYFAVKTYNTAKTLQSAYSNEVFAIVPTGLTATITANKTTGTAPLIVNFAAAVSPSTSTVSNWSWTIKNGATVVTTATGQNYTYQFNNAGTYTVSLNATGSSGTATATQTITVSASTASVPFANFATSVVSGVSPLTVNFTDQSTGTISSRTWDFGDGSSSTAASPSHTFTNNTSATVTYNVKLTVTSSAGSNTQTKTINVAASAVGLGGSTSLAQSLVAAYRFDEAGGSIVTDASGRNNHGTVTGAVPAVGKFGNALKFNGINNWVTVNDSDSLDLSAGMTLEAWIKPTLIQRSSILTKELIVGGRVFGMNSYDDADLPSSIINDGIAERVVAGNTQLPINTWTHLASTYDGSIQRLYINGQLAKSRVQTGKIKISGGNLRIGGNNFASEFFNGLIDEVKIYNRALTATEIQTDYGSEIGKTNGTQLLAGNSVLESTVDSNPQGIAEAFRTTATKTGFAVNTKVYIDSGSTVTDLVVGIYTDNNGHPGNLLAQGKLAWPAFGTTNTIPMPAVKLTAGTNYWLAILSSKGVVKFRTRSSGAVAAPMETSKSISLTNLPSLWSTGTIYQNGPMSVYVGGYQ